MDLLKINKMKYHLSKIGLEYDLEWLQKPNIELNNYGNVIRHLLNEVDELRQLSKPVVSQQRELLLDFLQWQYMDKSLEDGDKLMVETYLKEKSNNCN